MATSQLCKTNPISNTPQSPQHPAPQRLTPIFPSAAGRKTNPNKPNLPPRNTQYAIRNTKTNPIKPNLSRRSLRRSRIPPFTQYATKAPCGAIRDTPAPRGTSHIRHMKYEIRFTLHVSRLPLGGRYASRFARYDIRHTNPGFCFQFRPKTITCMAVLKMVRRPRL